MRTTSIRVENKFYKYTRIEGLMRQEWVFSTELFKLLLFKIYISNISCKVVHRVTLDLRQKQNDFNILLDFTTIKRLPWTFSNTRIVRSVATSKVTHVAISELNLEIYRAAMKPNTSSFVLWGLEILTGLIISARQSEHNEKIEKEGVENLNLTG